MNDGQQKCPNCGTELKDSILKSVLILSELEIDLINEYENNKSVGYCTKCGSEKLKLYKTKVHAEYHEVKKQFINTITYVPVLSIHTPLNWDYDAIGIVTGQSTSGTGFIAELASDFTDFFGAQSGRYNKKIYEGERIALTQLRIKTVRLGGNAVIATDIDYSELGSLKGMIMVCATGTAVKLKNPKILGTEKEHILEDIDNFSKRMAYLEEKFNSFIYGI